MKKPLTLTLLLLFLLFWLPGVKGKPFAPAQPLVFTHVTVIDTLQGRLYEDATVVIRGNLIAALGKTGKVPVPKDAQVIDATGKFLIPGLWDMHFHTPDDKQSREVFYPLAIVNGITGVRNVLEANPLTDIANTRKIAGVVLNGKYLPPESLQKMLADVEAIAK